MLLNKVVLWLLMGANFHVWLPKAATFQRSMIVQRPPNLQHRYGILVYAILGKNLGKKGRANALRITAVLSAHPKFLRVVMAVNILKAILELSARA